MTSKECKKLMKKLLYSKNYCGVIEEVVNTWNADIIGVKWSGEVNEFEIKVSLQDLRGEVRAITRALQGGIYRQEQSQWSMYTYNRVEVDENVSATKLEKHYHYLVENSKKSSNYGGTDESDKFVPSKFYFAVPTELVDNAKKLLQGVPKYGILDVQTGEFVKKASKLDRTNVKYRDMFNLFSRACTELRIKEGQAEHFIDLHENGEKIRVKKQYKWVDLRGEERIDYA